MIPGWLALGMEQRSLPISQPLPVKYERTYTDGSDGNLLIGSGAEWEAGWAYLECGVRLEEGYGRDGSVSTLRVTLVKPEVFGFMIFDWFNPPGENKTLPQYPNNQENDPNPDVSGAVVPIYSPFVGGSSPAFDESSGAFTPTFGEG